VDADAVGADTLVAGVLLLIVVMTREGNRMCKWADDVVVWV